MNRTTLRRGLVLSAAVVLLVGGACRRNHQPSAPVVAGEFSFRAGDTVSMYATATDQDDDSVSYLFAWGDTSAAEWTSGCPSGATVTGTHVYADSGEYTVRARARDDKGAESDWSDSLLIIVTERNRSPQQPQIQGPTSARPGDTLTFRFSSSRNSSIRGGNDKASRRRLVHPSKATAS